MVAAAKIFLGSCNLIFVLFFFFFLILFFVNFFPPLSFFLPPFLSLLFPWGFFFAPYFPLDPFRLVCPRERSFFFFSIFASYSSLNKRQQEREMEGRTFAFAESGTQREFGCHLRHWQTASDGLARQTAFPH